MFVASLEFYSVKAAFVASFIIDIGECETNGSLCDTYMSAAIAAQVTRLTLVLHSADRATQQDSQSSSPTCVVATVECTLPSTQGYQTAATFYRIVYASPAQHIHAFHGPTSPRRYVTAVHYSVAILRALVGPRKYRVCLECDCTYAIPLPFNQPQGTIWPLRDVAFPGPGQTSWLYIAPRLFGLLCLASPRRV